jgi:hypothetical protein
MRNRRGILLIIAMLYVLGYLVRTESYSGSIEGEKLTIRVFESKAESGLWRPLFLIESLFRTGEFDPHIKNGATFPMFDPEN